MNDVYDVIVVGFGFASGAAAIAAADRGASILLLEKMLDPGGISITAGGGMRACSDSDAAFAYIDTRESVR
jgi:succinate dehydrogenase/fumarate reductase flavoprotein subunit